MIGGNILLTLQKKISSKNDIGENLTTYTNYMTLKGWLDLNSASSTYTEYMAHIKDSSHVFVCDYVHITEKDTNLSALTEDGTRYDVNYIDNPQGRNRQIEIYLDCVGG